MNATKILTCVFLAVLVVAVYIGFKPDTATDALLSRNVDDLKFSNTQDWNSELEKVLIDSASSDQTSTYLEQISLSPAPTNSSEVTKSEIEELHALEQHERPLALSDIEAEVQTKNLRFGDFIYGDNDRPATTKLLEEARRQVLPVLLTLKRDVDRVRPSYIDPTLTTAITIPGHPAYPSGHATEARLIAILLSKLNPSNSDIYHADAIRIARNREIAGVHYPSDSEAGRALADQFSPLFLLTDEGSELFEKAALEWR